MDSPLEGGRFEPPVPLAKTSRSFRWNGKCRRGERGCVESVIYQAGTAGSIGARLTVAQPPRVANSSTPTRSRRSTALRHLSFVNRRAGKKRLGAPSPAPPNYRNLSRVALDRLVITEASTFTPPWRT
jgi:hypothetical protein